MGISVDSILLFSLFGGGDGGGGTGGRRIISSSVFQCHFVGQ